MRIVYAAFVLAMISTAWFAGMTVFIHGGHWLLWVAQSGFNALSAWVVTELDQSSAIPHLRWVVFPDLWWAMSVTVIGGVGLTAASAVGLAVTPVRWRVRSILGLKVYTRSELAKVNHKDLHERFKEIADGLGLIKPLSLRVAPVRGSVAFVVDAVGRAEVVLGIEMVSALNSRELDWVLAHELAHVRHRDLRWRSLWLASVRGLDRSRAVQRRLVVAKVWLMQRMGAPGAVITPMIAMWRLAWWSMRIGVRLILGIFLLGDRWMSRRMEFEADAAAAHATSPVAGVGVLRRLGGDGEPEFAGVLATHPDPVARVQKLKKLNH